MRKTISALLISILLLSTLSSCDVNYSESAWSDDLTEKTLHGVSFTEYLGEDLGGTGSIYGMAAASQITEGEKKELRTVTRGVARDYYTCAYIDSATVKVIEENPSFSTVGTFWSGKSHYITFYRDLVAKGKIDADAHPIRWIEIPKGDEIPEKYSGSTLAMICESYEVTITDLSTGETEKREAFYELCELYGESLSAQYQRYRDSQFPEAMLIYGSFNYGEDIFTMIELYDMHYYRGLDLVTIDSTVYVKSKSEVLFRTYDYEKQESNTLNLTEVCDHLQIDGEHYFALDDLTDIYMTYNIKPAE